MIPLKVFFRFIIIIIIDKTLNFKPYFVGSVATNCLLNIFFSFLLFNEKHSLKSFLSFIIIDKTVNCKPYFLTNC